MKTCFNNNPVVFVPSHRSYQDFILMAFVCFNYNIEIPFVAAAMGTFKIPCLKCAWCSRIKSRVVDCV